MQENLHFLLPSSKKMVITKTTDPISKSFQLQLALKLYANSDTEIFF